MIAAGYAPYPLAVVVGEKLVQSGKLKKAPDIQSTSPESAYKQFCAGNGLDTLDATIVFRTMNTTEQELCTSNDVKDITQIKLGNTAVVAVFAGNSTVGFAGLTRKDLFLAMAMEVPDPQGSGKMVANPYKSWKDINPSLPDLKIQVWNSSSAFAYYPIVLKQIMVVGCKQAGAWKNLESDPKGFETACTVFRKDGVYNEYSSLDNITQKLNNAIGIFADTFSRKLGLHAMPIDGIEPMPGSISHNLYPLISPLVIYIKKSHIAMVAGLKEYLLEATSEKAIANSGYLVNEGMVPLPLPERRKLQAEVQDMVR